MDMARHDADLAGVRRDDARAVRTVITSYSIHYTKLYDVQAINDGGSIFVTTGLSMDRKKVFLSITDTGTGMSEEMITQIFQPFVTSKNKGTGLGLAIVKHLVRIQGGKISVESQPGEGTCFTIVWPSYNFV